MNKKGLTLVELIAVIAIIALLALIIYPKVTKTINDLKGDTKTMQESSVKEAARQYLADHIGEENLFVEDKETVTLGQLIDEGYLVGSAKDTITGKNYDLENSTVVITRSGSNPNYIYNYTIKFYNE